MINREVVQYVEILYPGALLAEDETKVVQDFDPQKFEIPENAYAFKGYKRKKFSTTVEGEAFCKYGPSFDETGYFYPGGILYTLEDIATEWGTDSILYQNIKGNGYSFAVKHRAGGFMWFNPDKDMILS